MGKISPVSSKYIIHATIETDGIVEKPDVIGAIFGQTEGLLGTDLELRELQKSGRIGRIEVNVDVKGGKAQGTIDIPSSLDKAETAIVAAALEIIQRIGPCNAKISTSRIEDVRISKRSLVVERAKELLKQLTDNTMPDSQELADEVMYSVRVMEIQQYGKDRLPAGPFIDQSDEVIIVEGRADVLNLLKYGIKNAIAMNGTSVPQTIIDLSKGKTMVAFVDGDRGGDLNIKELMQVADIDFVCKAPDGKEVEELTKKEIHKALRARVAMEQVKMESSGAKEEDKSGEQRYPQGPARRPSYQQQIRPVQRTQTYQQQRPGSGYFRRPQPAIASEGKYTSPEEKAKFKSMLEDLIGTRGAYILDDKLTVLGKVPTSELVTTVKSLNSGIYAIVFDGSIERDLIEIAEKIKITSLVAMDTKVKPSETKVNILSASDL